MRFIIIILLCLSLNGCSLIAGYGMGDRGEKQAKSDAFHKKVCNVFDKF